jgi:NADH-quinone oxidoreductase subunit M
VLCPLGAYGLMRITLTAFPTGLGRFSLVLSILAAVGALWGFVAALGQRDVKRLIAYGGLGHMSVVLLAVSTGQSIALNGAVLMIMAQGFGTGLLYLLAGTLEERARTRDLDRLGGLAWQMPRFTALWVVGGLTVMGVPFLVGFSGELLVFSGSFPVHPWTTLVVLAGMSLTSGYILWMLQRAFFGPAKETFARVRDAGTLELFYLVPVAGVALLLGVFPGRLLPMINNGVLSIMSRINGG